MGYFLRTKKYYTKQSKEELVDFLKDYYEERKMFQFAFGIKLFYEVQTANREFLIKSKPLVGKGPYKAEHKGIMEDDFGRCQVTIETKIKKTGAYFFGIMLVLFLCSIWFIGGDVENGKVTKIYTDPTKWVLTFSMIAICSFWLITMTEIWYYFDKKKYERLLKLKQID